ncbi:MAG: hypothetical protein ABIS03_12215 [Gemmatimonadaceae bacterium]
MAEIRIEEKKRGAPWMMIMLLIAVAAVIGWWLWSNRSVGSETTEAPSGMVADSASMTPGGVIVDSTTGAPRTP